MVIFSSTLTGPTKSVSMLSNLWDKSGLLTLGGATVTVPMTPGASGIRELSGDRFRNDLYRSISDEEADLLNGSPKEIGNVEVSGRPKPNPMLCESLLFSSRLTGLDVLADNSGDFLLGGDWDLFFGEGERDLE